MGEKMSATRVRKKSDLYGFQQRGVTDLYEHDQRQAVLGMGAGKTALALTAIREMLDDGVIRNALVLAPKKVAQLVWPAEPGKWEHLRYTTIAVGVGDARRRLDMLRAQADVHVQTHDNIGWLVDILLKLPADDPLFDLLVIDEISRFRNPKSQRLKALMKVRKRFRNFWGLTGTPRPNGYEDQFGPLKLVTNSRLWGRSFYKWRDQNFFPVDWNGYNWSILPDARERIKADIASRSFAIPPEEMPELPEIVDDERTLEWVDLPREVMVEYARMLAKLIADAGGRKVLAANAAVASGKLEQIAQGFLYDEDRAAVVLHEAKAERLREMVEALAGDPVIVCYWFEADLDAIRNVLGDIPVIGKDTKDNVRTVAVGRPGRVPVMGLQPASGGHGLDGLQDSCSNMIWYTPIWSKELYDQTRKRVHRPGQKRRVMNWSIMARGTVDIAKRSRCLDGISAQDAFLQYLAKGARQ
jgi:hypothetical protein